MQSAGSASGGYIVLFILQIIFLIIFVLYVQYDDDLLPSNNDGVENSLPPKHVPSYKHFQDMHVMIFVGFAFLMTFLKKYAYSAIGFNLFIASITIQGALLARGCFHLSADGYIKLNIDSMIGAEVAAAVILISVGAVLGRTTLVQLSFMAVIEVVLFAANEYIQVEIIKMTDAGAAVILHAFGAYFGLGLAFILKPPSDHNGPGKNEGATYTSDMFAMIGSLFLWIYWPSFNTAGLDGDQQFRGILNTYLSLVGATVATFVISTFVTGNNKLNIVHIQNATLAGGVGAGAICNLLIGPHGALLIGILAGIIATLGYRYLTPFLASKLRLHDTCGVHNLHGMPAVLSGIASAIYAALATKEHYKNDLFEIYPARMELDSSMEMAQNSTYVIGGYGRSAYQQAGYQLLGVLVTVVFSTVAGILTGVFLKMPGFRRIERDDHHDDNVCWEVSEGQYKGNE